MEKDQNTNNYISLNDFKITQEEILKEVFTHPSFTNENKQCKNNSKLAWLGDALLKFTITKKLLDLAEQKQVTVQHLTEIRKDYECQTYLANLYRKIEFEREIQLGRGTGKQNPKSDNIHSEVLEAYIGGFYKETNNFPLLEKNLLAVIEQDLENTQDLESVSEQDVETYIQKKIHDKNILQQIKITIDRQLWFTSIQIQFIHPEPKSILEYGKSSKLAFERIQQKIKSQLK